MDSRRLHTILTRFRASFLAAFPALTAQDLRTILAGRSETLLEVLQARYGYTRAEAKAAWNDFVLTHVDGRQAECYRRAVIRWQQRRIAARPAPLLVVGERLDPCLWRLMLSDWGRRGGQGVAPGILGRPVHLLH